MTKIQRLWADERGPAAAYLVSFEAGDVHAADDGAGVPHDALSQVMRPTLDKDLPNWRSLDLVMTVGTVPGDGLAVGDGTNKAVPFGHCGAGAVVATNTLTIDSSVAIKGESQAPSVSLSLVGSIDADTALDAAELYRALVVISPNVAQRRPDDVPRPFVSLPEVFTVDLS